MNGAADAEQNQFNTLLLATDGSEFSAGTERVGLEMAKRHQARLHVLRLLLQQPGSDEAGAEEQEASLHLERVAAEGSIMGVEPVPMLRYTQDPSQGILSAAKEIGAQLIIIGRRGKRGLAKLMVGDATAKVVDKAECSVLVVPRLVSCWNQGVLLVVDPSQTEGDGAAQAAIALAKTAALPLTILYFTDKGESEAELREAYQSVNRLVAMAKLQEIEAEGMVQSGDLDDMILEEARQRGADLIVCEPRDRSVMDMIFNANNLIRLIGQVHCPVMVIKPGALAPVVREPEAALAD